MAGDRPKQPAYEIFSIECRFQQFKSGPSMFKEVCARGCQRGVPLLKVIIYPLLSCLTRKWLQIGTDILLNITSTSDVVFRIVNIDDLDWPWTLKIGVFGDLLAIFGCKGVNRDEMDGDRPRLPANMKCYRLSRVSWALAQISCSWSQAVDNWHIGIDRSQNLWWTARKTTPPWNMWQTMSKSQAGESSTAHLLASLMPRLHIRSSKDQAGAQRVF